MEQRQKKILKFEDVKELILAELQKRNAKIDFGIAESVTLVDGFLNEPFSNELSNSITISGPTLPMIMLVANETGRIYFFALKALLPDVWQ